MDEIEFLTGLLSTEGKKFKVKYLMDYLEENRSSISAQLSRAKSRGLVISISRGIYFIPSIPDIKKRIENIKPKKRNATKIRGGQGVGGKPQLKGLTHNHFINFFIKLEGENMSSLFIKLHDWETKHNKHNLIKRTKLQLPNGISADATVNSGPDRATMTVKINLAIIPIEHYIEQMENIKFNINSFLTELYYKYKIVTKNVDFTYSTKEKNKTTQHYSLKVPTDKYNKLKSFLRIDKDGYPRFPHGIIFLDESVSNAIYGGHLEVHDRNMASALIDNIENGKKDREDRQEIKNYQQQLEDRLERLEQSNETISRSLNLLLSKIEGPKQIIKDLENDDFTYQ